jgi:hypothetical protein
MHADQPTPDASSRQAPFRWPRTVIVDTLEKFADSDASSQRQFAEQEGIPQATLNYWQRQFSAAADDPIDSFFCSAAGELVLRRIVASAFVTFQQRGACGIRPIGEFLHLAQLDRYVATSRGALHPLAAHLESDLVAFRDEEQPLLAQEMLFRTITIIVDEHFHWVKPCLVAIEPVSGFILVECYRDNRNADTWAKAIEEGTANLDVQVVLLCSDLAKALLCCAEKSLEVAHSPDLFHGQRDLLKPLLLPLARPIHQAEKDLEKAERRCKKLDTPLAEPQTAEETSALIEATQQEAAIRARLQEAKDLKEAAVQEVRGFGDDYHPFDRETGKPVMAEEVGKRLGAHLDELQEVVQEAALGSRAQEAVVKARTWVGSLMGCVAWFWCLTNDRVEELALSEEQERVVKEKLLPGHYWAMAAGRARTAEERARLKEMAETLKKEAWHKDGALASLSEEEKRQVNEVAKERAGLFQRSSSCVEGRNGQLSLQHHGHGRVSEGRLQGQTVIHNYLIKRADGTTAAERFFGQKHEDLFAWLLQRMPELPRPAKKRPQPAGEGLSMAG